MPDEFQKYAVVAAYIDVLLRRIFEPRNRDPKLDAVTSLQTLALVARFAELAGGRTVSDSEFEERLKGLALQGPPTHAPQDKFVLGPEGDHTTAHCIGDLYQPVHCYPLWEEKYPM